MSHGEDGERFVPFPKGLEPLFRDYVSSKKHALFSVSYSTPRTGTMIDILVKLCPAIAGILYAIVGIGYLVKRDYPWALVWISYSLANLGLVLAAAQRSSV